MAIAVGFNGLVDVFGRRVSDVGIDVIRKAIDVSTAAYTEALNRITGVMVEDVDPLKPQERYKLPVSGTMQPLDEWGRPKPALGETYYTQAYPLEMSGYAWGANWVTLAKMTVQEANDHLLQAMRADADWNIRRILGSLFYNAAWTFADPQHGSLTINPLANGESTILYATRDGSLSTATHYTAQADALDTSHNPFPTIRNQLRKFVVNDGPVVVYINNAQRAAIEAISGFTEPSDDDITPGSGTSVLSGALTGHMGDEVCGKVDNCWIVEWSRVPASYLLAHVHGTKVVARRQQPEAELRGLIRREIAEGALVTYEFYRHAGYAPRNRVGAMCYLVGNANYSAPAAYATLPLPI